jgi:hypothetical protein
VAVTAANEPVRVRMKVCADCGALLPKVCYPTRTPRCRPCNRQPRERVRVFLDAEPLLVQIGMWVRARPLIELAREAGIPERSIRRIMSGESAHVRLDMADKLACAMNQPLGLLYPWE